MAIKNNNPHYVGKEEQMIKTEEDIRLEAVLDVAKKMGIAAITAPKGSGKDTVRVRIVTGEEKNKLADEMIKIGDEKQVSIFIRDGENLKRSQCAVLLGAVDKPFGMSKCSMCGYETCLDMVKGNGNCVFNLTDLGIAVGSACSIAADNRVDSRVMYTAGQGALNLGLFNEDVKICWGILLSAYSKNIYFDRDKSMVVNLK